MKRARLSLLVLLLVSVVGASLGLRGADAEGVLPSPGTTGFDLSYVQCGSKLPANGSFGVVGVAHGLPWSSNACLAQEFAWAQSRGNAGLYMNTANPAPHSSFFWPASGVSDPALCRDSTSVSDAGCAYDYGWHAAQDALRVATASLGTQAASVTWWLDVETTNTWNGTSSANAADIQGSIDYLRSQGVPSVGVYSTSYQWGVITGGYTSTNAAAYADRWAGEFVPRYPIAGAPNWIAGVSTLKRAQANCGTTFSGGPTVLVQYRSGSFDGDYACAANGGIKQSHNTLLAGLSVVN